MARSKPTVANRAGSRDNRDDNRDSHSEAPAHESPFAPHAASATSQEWLQNLASGVQRAVDTGLQLQQQWVRAATEGSENLAEEIRQLQQAKDPAELLSAQMTLANQQLELLSGQFSALLQQIHEAQLMWLGQWDKLAQEPHAQPTQAAQNNAVRSAWGKAQDDWLKLTRSWIDSVSPSGASH